MLLPQQTMDLVSRQGALIAPLLTTILQPIKMMDLVSIKIQMTALLQPTVLNVKSAKPMQMMFFVPFENAANKLSRVIRAACSGRAKGPAPGKLPWKEGRRIANGPWRLRPAEVGSRHGFIEYGATAWCCTHHLRILRSWQCPLRNKPCGRLAG